MGHSTQHGRVWATGVRGLTLTALGLTLACGSAFAAEAPRASAASMPGAGSAASAGSWRMGVAPALVDVNQTSVVVELSREQLAEQAARSGAMGPAERVQIDGLPLDLSRTVNLDLVRFRATVPGAWFEVMTPTGPQRLEFDPEQVVLLRGSVEGYPESHVYLAIGSEVSNGFIDLGPGAASSGQPRKYWVRESGGNGAGGHAGGDGGGVIPGAVKLEIFPAARGVAGGEGAIAVPLCGSDTGGMSEEPVLLQGQPPMGPGASFMDAGPILGMKQVEIAADTDQEYSTLFPNLTAAGEYIVQLYGGVGDIYITEFRSTVVLTYFRLWTTPDPWTNADPLTQFRNNWNSNQGAVPRDTAQLLQARTNLSAGGVAYLPGLCDGSGYSWTGYVLGHFGDPFRSDDFSRDIGIAGHELGHNVGSAHNHDYGLDTCQNSTTPAARSGLMGYCSQTVSGAGGNMDPRFETVPRSHIRETLESKSCIADDCNMNGVADSQDISLGTSPDVNTDGVPDECQDCNANLVLDPIEIALGQVPDVNANGLPDGCEPDCNGNGVPDDRDILLGTSSDAYLNGVPDECEVDCNNNGISDYTDIRLNMPLDVDRNIQLDSCQDCDGDTIIDRYELEHSHHAWVTSLTDTQVREFHSATGVLTQLSTAGINQGGDVLITPTGRILVTSTADSRIREYSVDGTMLADFAGAAQGLSNPTFMTLDPNGDLLVSNRGTNSVLKFDLPSGTPMGAFVTAGSGGLAAPYGLAYGPNGSLYVSSSTNNRVLRYNGTTGASLGIFVAAGAGGLSAPRGMCWLPNGNLIVASLNTFNLIQYNGTTGASMGQWQTGGNGSVLILDEPWDVVIGPTGDVFASASGLGPENVQGNPEPLHVTTGRVFQYNPSNGWLIKAYVVGRDTGLYRPTGIAFYPDFGTDCNLNALPDNCDISSGRSQDVNHNGKPDECETICRPDLTTTAIAGQPGYGVANGVINNDDFFYFLAQFAAGNLAVADMTTTAVVGSPGYGVPNGVINNDDFFYYLAIFAAGC